MTTATAQGKAAALEALEKRRETNRDRKRVDNSSLYTGSPMHFDCIGCSADIVVPESYVSKPDLCGECQAMKNLGWLE